MFAEMLQIDQQQLIGETSLEFAGSPELSPQFQRLGECGDWRGCAQVSGKFDEDI